MAVLLRLASMEKKWVLIAAVLAVYVYWLLLPSTVHKQIQVDLAARQKTVFDFLKNPKNLLKTNAVAKKVDVIEEKEEDQTTLSVCEYTEAAPFGDAVTRIRVRANGRESRITTEAFPVFGAIHVSVTWDITETKRSSSTDTVTTNLKTIIVVRGPRVLGHFAVLFMTPIQQGILDSTKSILESV